MTSYTATTVFERQVELTQHVLQFRRGFSAHLDAQVRPHVGQEHQDVLTSLLACLENNPLDASLPDALDGVMSMLRQAILDGTSEEKSAIPKERLIGGSGKAYDTRKVLSSDAEALQAALPLIQELSRSVRTAIDFAQAVRLSRSLFEPN